MRVFNNLPIERKLLLTSVIPIVALLALSLLTYRSVQAFSDDQDQLNRVYLVQRRSAEFMRLVVDLETGFRGFVLTGQDRYLKPFRDASERIPMVGDSIQYMVDAYDPQRAMVRDIRQLVAQLTKEKERLIDAMAAGHPSEARDYLEAGTGRVHMLEIRDKMGQFDRSQQDVLNDALLKIANDRRSITIAILGGGATALILMIVALQMIARSITGPLTALAKAVGTAPAGELPRVPVFDRRDEIGNLSLVMSAMSAQINDHIGRIEKSESELRTINLSLTDSESKYRSLVDHAPFGIFRTRGMAVEFSNRYNRLLAGLDPDEEGDPEAFRQSIHPEDRERVLSQYAEAIRQDRPYETIFRFVHKDGSVRKVLSRRIPIKDADGKTFMYQGFNIDITALDAMQERLRRAERLATLGQVAAGIAHEIRNPLVGIGSNASLLLDDIPPGAAHRPELEVILQETRRLDRIVNQIVDYAKPRTLAPTAFPLPALIEETERLVERELTAKRIEFHRDFHPALSPVVADRDQFKQVLLNVFQNAIDAMSEGGRLIVTACDHVAEGQAGTLIEVSDTGAGIQPRDLPRVFEPFFTTGKRRGTGLGLAICRNIIDAHRGDIILESRQGEGTQVRIWLPHRAPSGESGVLP
ncbi:MAG TPA: ATP-binding protein [Nitrospirales bacterium]|nr:ATP-binding protein [Nitrospirales bacterium]